jgi:Na+-driven multidrug efflux pump
MGAKNIHLARKYMYVTLAYGVFIYGVQILLITLLRNQIAGIYTDQEEILNHVLTGLPIMIFTILIHGFGKIFEGTVRGLGK